MCKNQKYANPVVQSSEWIHMHPHQKYGLKFQGIKLVPLNTIYSSTQESNNNVTKSDQARTRNSKGITKIKCSETIKVA